MPSQDRRRLNNLDHTKQARPQSRHPNQQRAINAARRQVCLSLPQSDIELMTEKEDLGLKPPPRFEQTGDEYRKQTDDREYPVH